MGVMVFGLILIFTGIVSFSFTQMELQLRIERFQPGAGLAFIGIGLYITVSAVIVLIKKRKS